MTCSAFAPRSGEGLLLRSHFKKMALSIEEIRKIASLSRLNLSSEEESLYLRQLGRVVEYIDQLKQYPSEEDTGDGSVQREACDIPVERGDQKWFLRNAPESLDRFLLVPQVKDSEK